MRKILFSKKKGMTLPEVLVSVAIGAALLAVILSTWYFIYNQWAVERIQSRLRINLEAALERIKAEVRLSSADRISFYKTAGVADYKAISFPMVTPDANGFYPLDESEKILWDKSVIYHTYDNAATGNTELRRTEFTDNNAVLTDNTERYDQLVSVVANGDGDSAPNSANASTWVLIKKGIDLTIVPKTQEFDGYSATVERSDNIEFGSIHLDPGTHDLRFEVTGKNEANVVPDGFGLGIDSITIAPSGGSREAETYIPQDSSGDVFTKIHAVGWSGNNYTNYAANSEGDFVTLRLDYDMWKESNFNGATQLNMVLRGNDLYVKLAAPDPDEIEVDASCWQASTQIGTGGVDYPDYGELPANVTVRNVLSEARIDKDGELTRVKFVAHSADDFAISEAWLMESAAAGSPEGIGGTEVQLFFSDTPVPVGDDELDGAGTTIGGTPGIDPINRTIPAGHYAWSNWAEFVIDETKEYFVTFVTPQANVTYWVPQKIGGVANSYYSELDSASADTWNNFQISPSIYAVEKVENWTSSGTVTSRIYDTKLVDPQYHRISWSQYKPLKTDIGLKARSSDDPDMAGATDWSAIAGSSLNPHALSIGSGRYVQFQATLSTIPPYTDFPWIDNVTIDWPGNEQMCEISAYFTKAADYGIIKLTVDGEELTKGLKFKVAVSEDFKETTYSATLTTEVEPRNTGR